ncbi:MAG: ABC transporter substrate-binding protein [Alphaproteobacteria bacterium]|nr:ABC transporter substrate-binding protein [Alphaproteobacteria bacterium]
MTSRFLGLVALGAALVVAGQASAQARLVLYCSSQEEWCQMLVNEFEKATGIRAAMTRKSSGEVYAQLRAEKASPRADVWWGGTGDPHLQAAEEGLTMAYDSPMIAELHPWASALWQTSGRRAVGIYSGAIGFGFNTELLAKKGLPEPKCWADLVKPEYKGEIQVANPHSSGTAYTLVATMVQLWGEQPGFDWLKKLNVNVNQYTKSGAAPIVAAARGETLIGISFMDDIVTQKVRNFPVQVVAPCEGTGYEIGAMSIVEGARNPDAAKRWYDWVLSTPAQELGIRAGLSYQTPSNRAAAPAPQGPKLSEIKLINYDFRKLGSAEERRRLLARWDSDIKTSP